MKGGPKLLRAAPALLRVGLAEAIAYRAEVLIWVLTATMPLVMLAIWSAVVEDVTVPGLDQRALTRYFTVTLIVRQCTSAWLVWELNNEIRSGSLSSHLLKPLSPVWLHVARNLVSYPLRFAVVAPVVGALVYFQPPMELELSIVKGLVFVLSCALAWASVFSMQLAFGSLAFFTGQSLGLFNLWFGLWSVFGGYLMPVSLLPGPLRVAGDYLPFRSMLSIPVEIGADLLPPAAWALALREQTLWAVFCLGVGLLAWRLGLRRYGAFGG